MSILAKGHKAVPRSIEEQNAYASGATPGDEGRRAVMPKAPNGTFVHG